MSYVDFDYLPTTTMVTIIELDGVVNILNIFPILEITRMNIPDKIRRSKKFKIPHPGFAGAILSATHRGFTRGIVKQGYFRHSIGIDISISTKNINLKLSKTGIQMCGVKSEEMVVEATNHLIDKIYQSQKMVEYIRENLEKAKSTMLWVKEKTKGPTKYVYIDTDIIVPVENIIFFSEFLEFEWETIIQDNGTTILKRNQKIKQLLQTDETAIGYVENKDLETFSRYKVQQVNTIIIPEEYYNGYPDGIDPLLANFFIEQAPDFNRHDFYSIQLNWLMNVGDIIEGEIKINKIKYAMVNYNYDLGFHIDRWNLHKYINGKNGFISRYENLSDDCVTIYLPYIIPDNLKEKISKKHKSLKHTFLVYKQGTVTQSGPHKELVKEAYNYFIATINSIRDHIIKSTSQRKIKINTDSIENILRVQQNKNLYC